MEYLLLGLIIGLLVGVFLAYKFLENRFRVKFKEWVLEQEGVIRRDALNRSRSVLKGRIAEQLAPFLPGFSYNPADARFIGNPVDFVIFDGYTEFKDDKSDKPISVVLMDVKKGESARLSKTERAIKKAVKAKRVKWKTLKIS
ncbi:endonuclease [archaeon]|nr:endonuclease [archaeon]